MWNKEKTFRAEMYSMYVYSISILICIVFLSFLGYSMFEFKIKEERNIQNILNSASQNLELQFAEVKKIKDAFYFNGVFQKAEQMNNPQLYQYYDQIKLNDMEDTYTMTLQKMMHTSSQKIRTIAFFPISGGDNVYCLGKGSADIKCKMYEGYQNEEWYQEVMENPEQVVYYQPHIPVYMENEKLGQVYSYICGVMNLDTHKLVGIVKIDVDDDEMKETLKMLSETENNHVVLLKDEEIFSQSGEEQKNLDSYIVYQKEIPNTALQVAYLSTSIKTYGAYLNIAIGSMAVILLASCLAFMNYRKRAKKMVNDVNQIMDIIREVESGKLDRHIEIRSDSEYQKIAHGINQMIDNLKDYIGREYILVIQQQKAQYLALQSQINPHFLYNTLNGFVALNRMGEKELLETSIIELAKLFRYTCDGKEVVSVQEEFDFLKNYLKLEKLKYDERLEYSFWIDEVCKQRKIPKLLLQPIVENCIKHGAGNTDRVIEIKISATEEELEGIGRAMVLLVSDNGVGFDINAKQGKEHVGIDNVRARAILYCKNAIYECSSTKGIGTKTSLTFPEEGE